MSYETIILTKKDSILHVKLNRPEFLNAINIKLVEELSQVAEEADRDKEVKVVILSGEGRAFCSGGDISFLQKISAMNAAEVRSFVLGVERQLGRIAFIDKPVIAAIHGFALGAGLSLALLCDICIATENALLGMEFIKIGIIPELGVKHLLPRLVGVTKAMELVLTGDRINGKEAERIGLINRAVPEDQLEAVTSELAKKIVGLAPIAIQLAKKSLKGDILQGLDAAFEYEADLNSICYLTEDFREAAQAFMEKRKPVFKGR
jgi:enoyl-CoA hydratase/carnithine racemase